MARPKLQLQPVSEAKGKLDLRVGTNTVAIAAIHLRRDGDARPLSAAHVVTLAESIAALGILEPVVVDQEGHLLAGGHRLAALQLLAEADAEVRKRAFMDRLVGRPDAAEDESEGDAAPAKETKGKAPKKTALEVIAQHLADVDTAIFAAMYPHAKVPVVAVDVSGKDGAGLAIAVEAAENSVRRQYSRDEVRALAVRLKSAGYTDRPGRPKKGEKSARPVLEALLGCSGRHLSRLLGKVDPEAPSEWDLAVAALQRAAARVEAEGKSRRSEENQKLVEVAARIGRMLGAE